MAAVTIGANAAGLVFGLTAEAGIGLIQSFSEARNIEKNEVRNNAGDIVAVGYYNATTSYSLSVAITGAYNVTAGAALAALANATTAIGNGSLRIDSITLNKSNDAFVTLDISATGYPNVS
jgi:hypothetical protein